MTPGRHGAQPRPSVLPYGGRVTGTVTLGEGDVGASVRLGPYRLLQRLGADVADYGFVETSAKQDGRNMTMVIAPHKGAKTRIKAAEGASAPSPAAAAAQADKPAGS